MSSLKGEMNEVLELGDHNLPTPSSTDVVSKDTAPKDTATTKDEIEIRSETRHFTKNLLCVCFCFLLVTAPLIALVDTITSILLDENIGFTVLAVSGATQLLTSAILVSYTTKVWGILRMKTVSMFLSLLFIISFFYPSPLLIIPAGGILGIAQSLLVSTAVMYGNSLGHWYAHFTKGNTGTVLVVISGLIKGCFGGGFLLGNVLLFAILNPGSEVGDDAANCTRVSYETCGGNYCNEDIGNMANMQHPVPWRYYAMIAAFSLMAIIGTLLSLSIKNSKYYKELGIVRRKKLEFLQMIEETWVLLKDSRGYFLIIITVFLGLEEAFVMSNFTLAYVSCVFGIPKVGLVMMAYGLSDVVMSFSQWCLYKLVGRISAVFLACIVLTACFVTCLYWTPDRDQIAVIYVIAVFWAGSDSFLMSTIFSVYAVLFKDIEGSFLVGNFWRSLGFTLFFGCSQFLCIDVKLYILLSIEAAGLISYSILEYLIKRKRFAKR